MKKILKSMLMLLTSLILISLGSLSQEIKAQAVEYSSRCSYDDLSSIDNFSGMDRLYQIYDYKYYWQGDTVKVNFWSSEKCSFLSGYIYKPDGSERSKLKAGASYYGGMWHIKTTDEDVGCYKYELLPVYSGTQTKSEIGYFYILSHPSDVTVFEGNTATFSVGNVGYPELTYQWFYSYSSTGTGGDNDSRGK